MLNYKEDETFFKNKYEEKKNEKTESHNIIDY